MVEFKVYPKTNSNIEELESDLNQLAIQGWEISGCNSSFIILNRRVWTPEHPESTNCHAKSS